MNKFKNITLVGLVASMLFTGAVSVGAEVNVKIPTGVVPVGSEVNTDYFIFEVDSNNAEPVGFSGSDYAYINNALYKIDELFGTTRDGSGVPSGIAFDKGVTLYDALNNSDLLGIADKNNEALKGIAEETFTDIKNHWCVQFVAMPVYYGVLNGYQDGTLRPDGSITAGELAKVVATAYESGIQPGGSLANSSFNGAWYNNYYRQIAKAFTYDTSNKITRGYMEKEIRRCEVAYILAKISDDGSLGTYINKATAGDISQMAHLGDFKNIATDSDGTLAKDQEIMSKGWIPARYAGAMMFLQAKGIMVGDGYNIHPLANVSRAEVFKMVQETCKTTTTYKSGSFRGKEVAYVISTPSNPSNPGTSGQNQKTFIYEADKVLNPDAPAKYQYCINDFTSSNSEYWKNKVLDGTRPIKSQIINSEKAKVIIDDLVDSLSYENGVITVTIPDLKSEYHEVYFEVSRSYKADSLQYKNGVDRVYSSQKSGTMTFLADGADYELLLRGFVISKGDGSTKSQYTLYWDLLTGERIVGGVERWHKLDKTKGGV